MANFKFNIEELCMIAVALDDEAHFEESQFELRRQDGWKRLKLTAVPTVFDVPDPLQNLSNKRKKGIGLPKRGTLLHKTPTASKSKKLRHPRKKLRRCDDSDNEGDKRDAVVQQILMNPDVIIKEEPAAKEEAECDGDPAGARQDFEFVSVKEEPVEDPDESTSPAPEEPCEQNGQDQELPIIIKEEIDGDEYIDPLRIS